MPTTITKPKWIDLGGGIKRRIISDGQELMVVEVHFQPGAEGYTHEHFQEQSSIVVSGGGMYSLDGVVYELKEGDAIHVLPNQVHGFVARNDMETVLLDIFTPPRLDIREEAAG